MNKNILFVERYLDPDTGGTQRVTYVLSKYLTDNGYNCFYLFCDWDTDSIPDSQKIIFDFLNEPTDRVENVLSNFVKKNNITIIINQDYDTFRLYSPLLAIKEKFNTKIIYTYHRNPFWGDFINNQKPQVNIIKNYIKRILKRKIVYPPFLKMYDISDKFVLLSNSFIKPFEIRYHIKDNHKLFAISNPLSFKYILNNEDFNAKKNNVLIISRFEEKIKNVKAALRIWKRIEDKGANNWELILGGYGKDEKEILDYAFSLRLENFKFIGKVDNPLEIYKLSSILLMTSKCEGFGLTIVEAQQCGCVPIAFDSYSSIKDIIQDGYNGFLIKAFDEKAYANKLYMLMQKNQLLKDLAFKASYSSSKFDIDNVGKQWIQLFTDIS